MRETTLLNRLLDLPGIVVRGVSVSGGQVVVDVALRRRRLHCPHCDYRTRWRYASGRVAWGNLTPRLPQIPA